MPRDSTALKRVLYFVCIYKGVHNQQMNFCTYSVNQIFDFSCYCCCINEEERSRMQSVQTVPFHMAVILPFSALHLSV